MRSRSASAASTFGAAWPVTMRIGLAREANAASAAWRTKGFPKRGAASFVSFGPASKRDDRPAARMIAAISTIGGHAWIWANTRLQQKPPNAHPHNVLTVHGNPGKNPVQHEIEPILLGRARAARGSN